MKNMGILVVLLVALAGITYFTSTSPLEMLATSTGLICVYLTAKENIWTWPIGLINVACFFYMFWEVKLYADMALQVFFFVLGIYGWIIWLTKRAGHKVRPTQRVKRWQAIGLGVALIVLSALWGYWLDQHTDASVPYMDAFIATLSLIAQFLLSYKVLENWLAWIVVDILSIGMYFYKELYAVSFLYAVFLTIAVAGWLAWKREYERVRRGDIDGGTMDRVNAGEIRAAAQGTSVAD